MMYSLSESYILQHYSLATLFDKYIDGLKLKMLLKGVDLDEVDSPDQPVVTETKEELEELYGYR